MGLQVLQFLKQTDHLVIDTSSTAGKSLRDALAIVNMSQLIAQLPTDLRSDHWCPFDAPWFQSDCSITNWEALTKWMTNSTLSCTSCKHRVSKPPIAWTRVQLDTRSVKMATFNIAEEFEKRAWAPVVGFKCPQCEEKTVEQRTEVTSLPEVLHVTFNRRYATLNNKKKQYRVAFDEKVTLHDKDTRSSKYECFAVLEHEGDTTSMGHWVAYLRIPNTIDPEQWILFDSGARGVGMQVKAVSASHVISRTKASHIFYVRRESTTTAPLTTTQEQLDTLVRDLANAAINVDAESQTEDNSHTHQSTPELFANTPTNVLLSTAQSETQSCLKNMTKAFCCSSIRRDDNREAMERISDLRDSTPQGTLKECSLGSLQGHTNRTHDARTEWPSEASRVSNPARLNDTCLYKDCRGGGAQKQHRGGRSNDDRAYLRAKTTRTRQFFFVLFLGRGA